MTLLLIKQVLFQRFETLVLEKNQIFCCGRNLEMQLGFGNSDSYLIPTLNTNFDDKNIVSGTFCSQSSTFISCKNKMNLFIFKF